MIRRIRGKVVEIGDDSVVVDVSGFGVEILCPSHVLEELREGDEAFLLTTFVFGEDPKLYGFLDGMERKVFEKLMKVSKIGPKTAIKILSSSDLETLVSMIKSGDPLALSKIPGIGRKTAERIITELKREFSDFEVEGIEGFSDALDALIALGYSSGEASGAIRKVAKPGMKVEDLIKEALRVLAKS